MFILGVFKWNAQLNIYDFVTRSIIETNRWQFVVFAAIWSDGYFGV